VTVYLGTNGHFDDVPLEDVRRFNAEIIEHIRHKHEGILAEIRDTGDFSDELANRLVEVTKEFKKGFVTSEGTPLVEAEAEAMDEEKVGQETVKVAKPAPK